MNTKQFLMLVISFSCAINGVSATVMQTYNAEQIVNEIIDEKLTVDDTVLYGHEPDVYTFDKFEVTKTDKYYRVKIILKKPIEFLGINWGDTCVKITADKGKIPLDSTQED